MKKPGLLDEIHSAFLEQGLPKSPDIELLPKCSETFEEIHEFLGKSWVDIDLGSFDRRTRVFSFLPDECLPYYFGTYLYKSVEGHEFWSMAFDMISDIPSFQGVCHKLSEKQLIATIHYLDYIEEFVELNLVKDVVYLAESTREVLKR